MTCFPQLSSGTTVQFPLRWSDSFGYITNVLCDGSTQLLRDPGATRAVWDISYDGITETERAGLQAFFESVCGALKPFTMLDPADNLLVFSEDFTQACWAPGPLLRIVPGAADPFGGTAAATLTNTAQAAQGVSQQINAPGGYRYCFSVYVRSESPVSLSLSLSSNGSGISQEFRTSPAWERATLSGTAGEGDAVSFGVETPSGAQVQLFGAQVEAQPAPGTYKRTAADAGVYEHCRFENDELQVTATGPGVYRCALRVRSAGNVSW